MELVLTITPEEKSHIRKCYNVTEEQIKEDVAIIKTWKEKQPHLPQDMTDDLIEKVLLRNKFRVERTKEKLDNYYSLRGLHRDLIQDFEKIVPTNHHTTFLPMPKLTPKFERIVIYKYLKSDPDTYDPMGVIKLNLGIEELCLQYDYAMGVRYLVDMGGFTLSHFIKIPPIATARHVTLLEKAYSQRILGIEFFNFPSFATKFMGLMKLLLRGKIYDKIRIHENLESLHAVIPKECLPVEYGGPLEAIPASLSKWDKVVKDHHDFFVKNYKNVALEHLRPADAAANEAFGVDGTFKRLGID